MLRSCLATFLLALAACGGKSKPSDTTIPESKLDSAAPTEVEDAPAGSGGAGEAPAGAGGGSQEELREQPTTPPPPVEVTIEASKATIKLLAPGSGKRAPLRLAPASGASQLVDLVMDAVIEQTPAGGSVEKVTMPTVVLTGKGDVKTLATDGVITYQTSITGVDAREAVGQSVAPQAIKAQLTSLVGMVIDGTLSAAALPGATKYTVATPNESTVGAIESVRLMLPTWLPLPTEPVALGARWEVSQPVEINNIATVQVTTFTLRGRTGTTMTIAGETKVVGLDQKLGDVQVSDISGQGTVELVVDTAKLYPRMKRTVSTKMRLRQGAEDVTVMMQLGSAFAPK